MIYIPASGLSADGLTATGCIRGIEPSGLDYNTANTTYSVAHDAGEPVFCAVAAVEGELNNAAMRGAIATGGADFRVGLETDVDITYYAENADANPPFLRYSASGNEWLFSNDGSSTAAIGTGGGAITGGDGISVTSGDIDVDLTDTVIFVQTSSGAGDSGKVMRVEADGFLDLDFLGTTATLTAANLDTLIDGSNADALHVHANPTLSFRTAEAVTADDAVALLPVEVEFYTQLTDTNLALGDSNTRRRYAVQFVPKVTSSTLTTMLFRAAEAVNGATTLGDLDISIQGDSSGEPDGTPIANGSANAITQATQRTWNVTQANRTATWASSPTLTMGTTYWLVFEVASTDATNFLNISGNNAHNENYITFTRLTYDLDAGTWGGSVTNATPFFWFDSQIKLLGLGIVPCDADWGARTWNFIGFVSATVAIDTAASVYYDVVPNLASLTPGEDYYLSSTAGATTQTPPAGDHQGATEATAYTYKIGRAISTTDLKVEPGQKRVIIRETSSLTATTTRQYLLWFKPEFIRVNAAHSGSSDSTASMGYVLANATDSAIGMTYQNSGAGVIGSSTINSIIDNSVGDDFVGAASAFTDVGFTYTYTETGTASVYAYIEAIR